MLRLGLLLTLLASLALLPSCSRDSVTGPDAAGPAPHPLHTMVEPDPANILLDDADIYTVIGNDLLTVIATPFPDNALVGMWISVKLTEDQPREYFQITSNQFFLQNSTSVFTVAEDLETAGGSDWWFYDGQNTFDIVGPPSEAEEEAGVETRRPPRHRCNPRTDKIENAP